MGCFVSVLPVGMKSGPGKVTGKRARTMHCGLNDMEMTNVQCSQHLGIHVLVSSACPVQVYSGSLPTRTEWIN